MPQAGWQVAWTQQVLQPDQNGTKCNNLAGRALGAVCKWRPAPVGTALCARSQVNLSQQGWLLYVVSLVNEADHQPTGLARLGLLACELRPSRFDLLACRGPGGLLAFSLRLVSLRGPWWLVSLLTQAFSLRLVSLRWAWGCVSRLA